MAKILKAFFVAMSVIVIGGMIGSYWIGSQIDSSQSTVVAAEPNFSMRGLGPELTLENAKSQKLVINCESVEKGQAWCDLTDPVVGGVNSIDTYVTFESGNFNSLVVGFSRFDIDRISDVLTSAYGETCESNVKILQNAFSAKYSSAERKWCFKGGEMVLSERSTENVRESVLSYAPYKKDMPDKIYNPSEI